MTRNLKIEPGPHWRVGDDCSHHNATTALRHAMEV